jgi:RimJ/RimL family protein N-acetyltransferase
MPTLAATHAVPPDPPLTDGVVALRTWRRSDVQELARCCDDEEIARWLDSVPHPYTEADAADYVGRAARWWREGSFFPFAVTDSASGRLLGAVGCGWADEPARVAELGYWTRSDARGRGTAPAALRLASRWVIETLGAERVQVRVEVENAASQRVAEKAGFTREGVLRSSGWSGRRRRRLDFVVYSLLPGEQA